MATVNEKMTAIANEIRTLSGTTEKMGLDAMATNVNEANVEIDDQTELLAQAIVALEGKAGGGGVSLPELTNEGTAADLLSGKQLIDSEGKIVEGTIETKTASNLTASGATVTVPAGYYASQATKTISSGSAKTPATTVTKTPTISVNASGLITASVSGTQSVTPTVSAGYVSSGTAGTITVSGSATKQLTTQAAKTVTPTKSSQTAVASGKYTTGAVTVAAIPSEYVTTTDATASAADMRLNATAYVNGSKVTGAIEDFDGSYECSGDSTGGGEGGASIETCTVTITNQATSMSKRNTYVCYSYLENGTISSLITGGINYVLENVPRNSILTIHTFSSNSTIETSVTANATKMFGHSNAATYSVGTDAAGDASITINVT